MRARVSPIRSRTDRQDASSYMSNREMRVSPLRRALALFLCCQPLLWMNGVAYAQTLQDLQRLRGPQREADDGNDRNDGTRSLEDDPETFGAPPSASPLFAPPEARERTRDSEQDRASPAAAGALSSAIDQPVDPDLYVCGPGDVFQLNFWGLANMNVRVTVDVEGRAFVPKVGYVDLNGKTLTDARRMMRASVGRYYPRLGFDVTLAQPRTFLVQVVNAVANPGSYPARAVDRVATVITRAGGLGPKASLRRIEIRRRDGSVVNADLQLYALTGDVKHNPFLLDGDAVRVPYEELAATIDGAVNRPGRYELVATRDLAELVQIAGGLAPTATQQLPISVVRRMADDRQDQALLDFGADRALPAAALRHEDRVHIPDFVEVQRSVMVVGAIKGVQRTGGAAVGATGTATAGSTAPDEATATRRLPFAEGDTVRTLLERVGGVGPLADLTGSYLLRAGKSIPVDLNALVMLRDLAADVPVELGDTLVVPFKRRNILVQGAVFTPGSYPYNPNYGVEQYLALAGGRNRFAQSVSDVRVVTPTGETKPFRRDLVVEPGSSVVVPERNFSRAEVVQIALGIASVLVSGVAVVLAAQR